MRLPRTSPWDAEFAAQSPRALSELTGEFNDRRTRLWKASMRRRYGPRYWLWFHIPGIVIGSVLVIIVAWSFVDDEGVDDLIKGPVGRALGLVFWSAIVGVLACFGGLELFRALRNPAPANTAAIRAASRLRLRSYRRLPHENDPVANPDFLGAHGARVRGWRAALRSAPNISSDFASASLAPAANILAALFPLMLLPYWGAMLFGDVLPPGGFSVWYFAPFLALTYGRWMCAPVWHRLARRRLRRALEQHRCPQCCYHLAGVPPAVPVDVIPDLGPERCPECASPWPLVPPPLPAA